MKKKKLSVVIVLVGSGLLVFGLLTQASEEFKATMAIWIALGYSVRMATSNKVLDEEV